MEWTVLRTGLSRTLSSPSIRQRNSAAVGAEASSRSRHALIARLRDPRRGGQAYPERQERNRSGDSSGDIQAGGAFMSTDLLERMKAAIAQAAAHEWQTPAHEEIDLATVDHEDLGLDPYNYDDPLVIKIYEAREVRAKTDPLRYVRDAVSRGFHVFGLQPKSKITLTGSHGFKDAKQPSDPDVLHPWNEDPTRNLGIALGESDLCVLDFDIDKDIPEWLNQTRTYKVKTSRGVHVYFRGARPSTGLYVGGKKVGDIKSVGGYVLAAGSTHPSGAIYTVVDDSAIASAPDRMSELLKHEDKAPVNASPDGPPIPYGSHDNELTRIAGLLRNASMNPQDIEEHLIRVCERRCEGYGSDYKEMCRKIAKSIGKKPVVQAAPPVIFGGNGQAKPEE